MMTASFNDEDDDIDKYDTEDTENIITIAMGRSALHQSNYFLQLW